MSIFFFFLGGGGGGKYTEQKWKRYTYILAQKLKNSSYFIF